MKIFKRILIALAVLIVGYIIVKSLVNTGAVMASSKKIEGIEESGIQLDDIVIPSDVRVVALGEATYGNAEFQAAKLDMLKKMIADGNCRSITFDISVGEGALINSAIHGNGAHLTELVAELDHSYYDTQQIIDLLAWMREFNKGRSYDNSVFFYGTDMQEADSCVEYLSEFAKVHPEAFKDGEIEKIEAFVTAGADADFAGDREFFQNLYDHLSRSTNTDYMMAAMSAGAVLQSINLAGVEDATSYEDYRTACVASNIQVISAIEEHRGYSRILVTAHNSLIMKGATDASNSTLGQRLDELFAGQYFCIGTDYYNTVVNLHTAGTYDEAYVRKDHTYCSEDIMAYQASFFEEGRYVLVFDDISEDQSRLYRTIHEDNYTGLIGDEYALSMDLHKTYHIKLKAADRYDAMLYYYETTPIKILH